MQACLVNGFHASRVGTLMVRSMTQQQLLVSVTFQERFQGSKSHSNTNQDSAKCSQASNHLRSLYLFEKASATCRKRLFMLFCRILEQLATAVSKFQTNTKMPRNCVEAQTGEHHHQNLPYKLLSNFMLKWIATWKGKGSFPSPSSRLQGKR